MKRIINFLLFVSVLYLSVNVITANANLNISARSACLIEASSQRVLYEKNAHNQYLTASIAKIMTAIIAIENGELEKYYEVDQASASQIGCSIYLKVGEHIKLIDLIYGLMLRSGNDAAYMIALIVGDSIEGFALMMNDYAKKIKMTNSTFENPSGLDDDSKNYSTAYDMAILTAYAMENDLYRKITATVNYSAETKEGTKMYFRNTHRMIGADKNVTGGKPGYTEKAHRTLVTSAKEDGMELIAVTFNSGNDWNEHRRMFKFGFDNFQLFTLIKKQVITFHKDIYSFSGIVNRDINYPVTKAELPQLSCIASFYKKPPKGDVIGYVTIYLNNKKLTTTNIYRYKK